LFVIDLIDLNFICDPTIKQRGINSLLDIRVSTPTLLTSIPRRTKYGICLLALEELPSSNEDKWKSGCQGQQQVLSDYNMLFEFVFFFCSIILVQLLLFAFNLQK